MIQSNLGKKKESQMLNILIGLLVMQGWVVSDSHQTTLSLLDTGKAIYLKRCKVCHGEKGDGGSFASNVLDPRPKNFTNPESKKELTLERMLRSVTRGRPGTAMMPWENNLTPEEIRAVVQYIRHRLMDMKD